MAEHRPDEGDVGDQSYDDMIEELEDLRDRISVHERTGVTIPAEQLAAELGLTDED